VKHFVGDGGTSQGKDMDNTVTSYEALVEVHMRAYPAAIAKGVLTIMVSYSSWNNQKMHANKFLLTDVLKGRLGFRGFVISDWGGIDRIATSWGANYANSVRLGINAGIDMVQSSHPTFCRGWV
jgi:beta-glucosidase